MKSAKVKHVGAKWDTSELPPTYRLEGILHGVDSSVVGNLIKHLPLPPINLIGLSLPGMSPVASITRPFQCPLTSNEAAEWTKA